MNLIRVLPRSVSSESAPRELDFASFFAAVYERLFRAMVVSCGDPVEAEDLAQEAMVRAYEHWDRIRTADSPDNYVFKIAFNLNRKRLRRAAAALRKLRHMGYEGDESADHSDAVVSRDQALRIVASMPATLKQAVVLVELLGMTAEEAGHFLGITAASVRGRLHRAREFARERYGGQDG